MSSLRTVGVSPRLLTVVIGVALLLQGVAVSLSRNGCFGSGLLLFFVAIVGPYLAGVACLLRRGLSASARRWIVVATGLLPTVLFRLTDPLLLTGFDEQLHLRTLGDLLAGGPLFSPNPLLQISPSYPGLELLTLFLVRATHLPTMAAVTVVVLVCRVVLVLALYQFAILVLRQRRAASLAVACYAASPQFYFFNSQYAYQTLALSLSLVGLMLLTRATRARTCRGWLALAAFGCFAGGVVTHHLTSWVTVVVLLVWSVAARRGQRRVVAAVAGGTVVLAALWAVPLASRLGGYLGPVFAEATDQLAHLLDGRAQRVMFVDPAGVATPWWERIVLIMYVVICVVAALVTGWSILRRAGRSRSLLLLGWGLACLGYPLVFAAHFTPQAAEIGDRATTFAFLPLALGVAAWLGLWLRRQAQPTGVPTGTLPRRAVLAVAAVSTVAFLGGLLLGSGPDWGRLPGGYLAVADSRSLDPETLAAADWSRRHLRPGESIMADRVPGTVLSSTAHLWVDRQPRAGVEPASLYFSTTWRPEQTQTVRRMGLRYLYVDLRLAGSPPHERWYFYPGETPRPQQLSMAQLTKFDLVPGIGPSYRHGPITIYDLRGLRVHTRQQGWLGSWRPQPWRDALIGLALGILLAWQWPRVRQRVGRVATGLGGAGSAGVAMSGIVLGTALAVAVGFQPGWQLFAALAAPVLVTGLLRGLRTRRSGASGGARPSGDRRRPAVATIAVTVIAVVAAAVGIGLALRSAWQVDIVGTDQIVAAVRAGHG